jgi:hypothetical protein
MMDFISFDAELLAALPDDNTLLLLVVEDAVLLKDEHLRSALDAEELTEMLDALLYVASDSSLSPSLPDVSSDICPLWIVSLIRTGILHCIRSAK